MNRERIICLLEGDFGSQTYLLSLAAFVDSRRTGFDYSSELKTNICANCKVYKEEFCRGIEHKAFIDRKKLEIMQTTIIPKRSDETIDEVKKDCAIYQKFNPPTSSTK